MRNFIKSHVIIIVGIVISIIFLIMEINKMLFLNKGVENSLIDEILVAVSYFIAQAVFIIMVIYATKFNIKYFLENKKKTTKVKSLMILSWILEILAIFYFLVANSTPIMYFQPLLIIGLILLCVGLNYYIKMRNYLSKAMIFWGIAILIFLCISDMFYMLLFVPFDMMEMQL